MLYNIGHFLKLILYSFSLDPGSLRFIHPKRILRMLVVVPFIITSVFFAWLFLGLDEIFFPKYRKVSLKKSLFIVGLPRSGTTFLYSLLASDDKNFHCMKLWELAFAPSITQKFLLIAIYKFDRFLGGYLRLMLTKLDDYVFGNFKGIHDIGLFKPEEDEAVFIYNLSSVYFIYLFPDVASLEKLYRFDSLVSEKLRKKNIQFYYRLLQRHKYVFDRQEEKYFLSKNPTFAAKILTVAERFENAKFIIPNRSPFQTIPSTISLNKHIYSAFCKVSNDYPLIEKTRELVLDWYNYLFAIHAEKLRDRSVIIDYEDIITNPVTCLFQCYELAGIKISVERLQRQNNKVFSKKYQSPHRYPSSLGFEDEKFGVSVKKAIKKRNALIDQTVK